MLAYRIHAREEAIETVLDAGRSDGWVASDEDRETQPRGISCSSSLSELAAYVRHYGLNVREGDTLLEMSGDLYYTDRDEHAARMIVSEVDSLGSALDWAKAIELDLRDVEYLVEDEGWDAVEATHGAGVARWLRDRIEDNY